MRILAVLTKGDTVAGTLDAAVLAAASVACSSIEALNVMVDPMHLVSAPEEIDIQELREHDEGSAQQRAEAIETAFGEWNTVLRPGAPPIDLRTITGAEAEIVMRETTEDIGLVVLSHNRNMDASDAFHAALSPLAGQFCWLRRAGDPETASGFRMSLLDSQIAI